MKQLISSMKYTKNDLVTMAYSQQDFQNPWRSALDEKNSGSGWGSVGGLVASVTRGPQLEYSHQLILI